MLRRAALLVTVAALGCSEKQPEPDAGTSPDSGPPITRDVGPTDAGADGGAEARDAGADACGTAVETCNDADDDCDGAVDETVRVDCWADADGDGYARPEATPTMACACGGSTTGNDPAAAADCDDRARRVSPDAEETCDGVDEDCDAMIDEGTFVAGCWVDADRDGYAALRADFVEVCTETCPAGTTSRFPEDATSIDCDDGRADAYPMPEAPEDLCDCVDNDCDYMTDENVTADYTTYFDDRDGDGYGPSFTAVSLCACDPRARGLVTRDGDCCDADPNAYLGQPAFFTRINGCGSWDYDCSGAIDYEHPRTTGSCAFEPLACTAGEMSICAAESPDGFWARSPAPECGITSQRADAGCRLGCMPTLTCRPAPGTSLTVACR